MPTLAVKIGSADVAAAIRDVRGLLEEMDRSLPVFNIRSAETQSQRELAQERLATRAFTVFGALALLLAAIGFYGVIACDIARCVPEIALRLAIGAERRSLIRTLVTDSLRLVLIGVVVGLPLAYVAARLSASVLHLDPADPAVFVGTLLAILVTGTGVAWLPARYAVQVDPVSVLRVR
jgi:ABC-type antimicrobial peptide transport system permease subunit